jgi:glycosyltransferase involved in cell wall biosynthesis
MNILMVHPHDLFSTLEPWTVRIKSIACALEKNGHFVKICYFSFDGGSPAFKKDLGSVELHILDRRRSPAAFLRNTVELVRLARWADVVHLQKSQHYAALPAVAAAYWTSKPLHYDWDDWEEMIFLESCESSHNTPIIALMFRLLEKYLPVLADTVSVASRALKKKVLRSGKKEVFVFDAPVGADLEQFRPGLDGQWVKKKHGITGPFVLYIGQLHGGQYADLFIQAANNILHRQPGTRFMIVGEGYALKKLKELVLRLGIKDKVIFSGAVLHEKIPFYIAAADVCVATFKDTALARCKSPLKIVEYMACGKPIVASNVGDVPLMLGGVGLLTQPGDFASMAEGILKLLKDQDLRIKMGHLARLRAERRFSWQTTVDNLLSAYSKAIGQPNDVG